MDERQERGLAIAALSPIKQSKVGYIVPSQSGKGTYVVNLDGGQPFCSCPDFEARHLPCKHIYAVEFTIQRETKADGTTVETRTVKVTYGQNWPIYDTVQMHEPEHFVRLLQELCETIPQPESKATGRPTPSAL